MEAPLRGRGESPLTNSRARTDCAPALPPGGRQPRTDTNYPQQPREERGGERGRPTDKPAGPAPPPRPCVRQRRAPGSGPAAGRTPPRSPPSASTPADLRRQQNNSNTQRPGGRKGGAHAGPLPPSWLRRRGLGKGAGRHGAGRRLPSPAAAGCPRRAPARRGWWRGRAGRGLERGGRGAEVSAGLRPGLAAGPPGPPAAEARAGVVFMSVLSPSCLGCAPAGAKRGWRGEALPACLDSTSVARGSDPLPPPPVPPLPAQPCVWHGPGQVCVRDPARPSSGLRSPREGPRCPWGPLPARGCGVRGAAGRRLCPGTALAARDSFQRSALYAPSVKWRHSQPQKKTEGLHWEQYFLKNVSWLTV